MRFVNKLTTKTKYFKSSSLLFRSVILILLLIIGISFCVHITSQNLSTQIYPDITKQESSQNEISSSPKDIYHCDELANRMPSTPEIINCSYKNKEITEDQRILYLSYAIGDFNKLPLKYRSDTGWFGETVLDELNNLVSTKSKFCSLSSNTRSELKMRYPHAVECL